LEFRPAGFRLAGPMTLNAEAEATMPTYDYQCEKCGKTFEVFHGMSETPAVKCTKRGCAGRARKLIGAGSGLIFKGSGFYITDYKNAKNGKGSEAKAESTSESKSESKGESKAASKSESKAPAKAETSSATKGGGCCGSC
jgi:putative FmdB family regulatory protein